MAFDADEDAMKEWFAAAGKFGAPSVLIAFLLWWLTGDFNVRLRAIEGQHQQMIEQSIRQKDLTERSNVLTGRILAVLQATCINDAKNAEARRNCLEER